MKGILHINIWTISKIDRYDQCGNRKKDALNVIIYLISFLLKLKIGFYSQSHTNALSILKVILFELFCDSGRYYVRGINIWSKPQTTKSKNIPPQETTCDNGDTDYSSHYHGNILGYFFISQY